MVGQRGQVARKERLTLVGLDRNEANGLDLSFTDGAAEYQWRFDAASLQEFYAILLKGRMQDSQRVVVDDVNVSVAPSRETDGAADLVLTLETIEIVTPLDRRALKRLQQAIEQITKRDS